MTVMRADLAYFVWWMSSSARMGRRRLSVVEVVDSDAVGDVAVVKLLIKLLQLMGQSGSVVLWCLRKKKSKLCVVGCKMVIE